METAWGHSLSVAAETNVLTKKNIVLNLYYVNRNYEIYSWRNLPQTF